MADDVVLRLWNAVDEIDAGEFHQEPLRALLLEVATELTRERAARARWVERASECDRLLMAERERQLEEAGFVPVGSAHPSVDGRRWQFHDNNTVHMEDVATYIRVEVADRVS